MAGAVTSTRIELKSGQVLVEGAASAGRFVTVESTTSVAGARAGTNWTYQVQASDFTAPDCRLAINDHVAPAITVIVPGCTRSAKPVPTQRLAALAQRRPPRPLLRRPGQAVRALRSPTTLPVGIGGGTPQLGQERLQRDGRVLFYTDGITEERTAGGAQFGERRLVEQFTQAEQAGGPVQQTVRRLSHALLRARGGTTSDDATLLLLQWRGNDPNHLTSPRTTSPQE